MLPGVCLPVDCLSFYPSVHKVCLHGCLSFVHVCLSLSAYLFGLSRRLSYLSDYIFRQSACQPIGPVSVRLPVCLSISLFAYAYLPPCLPVCLPTSAYICLSVCLLPGWQSAHRSTSLTIYLSVLSVCLCSSTSLTVSASLCLVCLPSYTSLSPYPPTHPPIPQPIHTSPTRPSTHPHTLYSPPVQSPWR